MCIDKWALDGDKERSHAFPKGTRSQKIVLFGTTYLPCTQFEQIVPLFATLNFFLCHLHLLDHHFWDSFKFFSSN